MKLFGKITTLSFESKLEKRGYAALLLMFRAAKEVYRIVKKYDYEYLICIAGSGNNGGDAIIVAFHAFLDNKKVIIINTLKNKGNALEAFKLVKKININTDVSLPKLSEINKKSIVIDGLLGIGINRKPSNKTLNAIKWINKAKLKGARIISIDVPSGINADNGTIYGECVEADETVMCLTPKIGCYTGDGLKYSGKKYFKKIVNKTYYKSLKTNFYLLKKKKYIKYRENNFAHKGNFGNVLILGGWDEMPGAGNLSSLAALRTGAGKVFLCTNAHKIKFSSEIINVKNELAAIKKSLKHIQVIVAGPGLGNNAHDILEYLWKTDKTLVLDADGLNWLSKSFLKKRRGKLICTPHYGEAKRLLSKNFQDRISAIYELKQKYGGNWILKGPGTIVLNNKVYINDFANNIMASAGTGDVLAGIIGGLIAQGIKKPEVKAVQLHSLCAHTLIKEKKRTLIASDLVSKISSLIK